MNDIETRPRVGDFCVYRAQFRSVVGVVASLEGSLFLLKGSGRALEVWYDDSYRIISPVTIGDFRLLFFETMAERIRAGEVFNTIYTDQMDLLKRGFDPLPLAPPLFATEELQGLFTELAVVLDPNEWVFAHWALFGDTAR